MLEVRLDCVDKSRELFSSIFPLDSPRVFVATLLRRRRAIYDDTYAYVCITCSTIVSTILLIVIKLQLHYRKYFIRVTNSGDTLLRARISQ